MAFLLLFYDETLDTLSTLAHAFSYYVARILKSNVIEFRYVHYVDYNLF